MLLERRWRVIEPLSYCCLGVVLIFALLPYTGLPFIHRTLLAKDAQQFKNSFYIVGASSFVFLAIVGVLGLALHQMNPNVDPNTVVFHFIDNYMPVFLKGIVLAGIFAIAMSTQDSYLNSISISISRDMIGEFLPNMSDKTKVLVARLSCILISLASISVVMAADSLVSIVWMANNFLNESLPA